MLCSRISHYSLGRGELLWLYNEPVNQLMVIVSLVLEADYCLGEIIGFEGACNW